MAVLSRLLFAVNQKLPNSNELLARILSKSNKNVLQNQGTIRCMSDHHSMDITASRWQWHKTKDWAHFYFLVGAIPVVLGITYCNVFIGPATLEPIPEGYVPKQWEYYRHPITRFISRYLAPNIQMEYEKFLHKVAVTEEKRQLFFLRQRVKNMIKKHGDYKYWHYKDSNVDNLIEMRKLIDKDSVLFIP